MKQIDRNTLIEFLSNAETPVTKRELARALNVKGDDRILLKQLLRELEEEGVLVKQPGQEYAVPKGLPSVGIIEITDIDVDGDMLARPTEWNEAAQGPMPRIEVAPVEGRGHPAELDGGSGHEVQGVRLLGQVGPSQRVQRRPDIGGAVVAGCGGRPAVVRRPAARGVADRGGEVADLPPLIRRGATDGEQWRGHGRDVPFETMVSLSCSTHTARSTPTNAHANPSEPHCENSPGAATSFGLLGLPFGSHSCSAFGRSP